MKSKKLTKVQVKILDNLKNLFPILSEDAQNKTLEATNGLVFIRSLVGDKEKIKF